MGEAGDFTKGVGDGSEQVGFEGIIVTVTADKLAVRTELLQEESAAGIEDVAVPGDGNPAAVIGDYKRAAEVIAEDGDNLGAGEDAGVSDAREIAGERR